MSLSVYIDNRKKYILILGKGLAKGLDDTTLTTEAQHSINFKFLFRLYYDGESNFLFVNATKIYQFKLKNSEIKKRFCV